MSALSAKAYNDDIKSYVEEGIERAQGLGNRGPIKFSDDGTLAPEILEAYARTGFYVFEGLVDDAEISLLQDEIQSLLERAPIDNGASTDRQGRPAFGTDFKKAVYTLVRPLSDPWGGTDALNGRHPTQMAQPTADADAPDMVVFALQGMCQIMDSGLRLYGHPKLLSIAATINGDDFVPYTEVVFVKQPGVGGSVSWHQDGVTHWDSPEWDENIHGFNFQVQLYDTSAQSCLWVVPGSHKLGKVDIKQMVEDSGSDRLPDAVPLYAKAGDVTIVNRQALHGSFANTSNDLRVSLTVGFHRRKSVLGASGALAEPTGAYYDEKLIDERSQVIAVGIDARSKFYPDEQSFNYQPMVGREGELRFTPENWEKIIRDYNLKDLAI